MPTKAVRSKTTTSSKSPRQKKTPSSDGKRPSRSDPNKWNRTVLRHGDRLIALVEAAEAMMTALKNHFCVNIDPFLPDLPGMANTRKALLRQAFAAFKKAAKDGWAGATQSHDEENARVFMVRWGDHDWPPSVCEASVLLNALVSAMESPDSLGYDPFMLTLQKTQWMQSMTRAANLIVQAMNGAAAEKSNHNGGQENPPVTVAVVKPNGGENVGDDPRAGKKLPQNPSLPMSFTQAATHYGGQMTARKLSNLVKTGALRATKFSRQLYVFSRDDAPQLPGK